MDTRGQPVQVGVIVLFGFLVIAFALFQAVIVPQQNAEVEFGHNQEVQQQFTELRSVILRAGVTGEGYPVFVSIGTTYPPRLLAVNPPPASGTVRTLAPAGGGDLIVANAEATDVEVQDYWDGSNRSYATAGLVYEPNYNVYQDAPTIAYEHGVLYNRAPDGNVAITTDQRLVDGRSLDLTVLQGSYQASSSGTATVDVSSPTAPPRTILVEPKDGPVNVSFPTALPASTWRDLFDDEGYVATVSKAGGVLTVSMQRTDASGEPIQYRLTVPAAAVGSNVPTTNATYATAVSGDGTSIPEGATQQVVAEVRNGFNGPESGVETCATLRGGSPGTLRPQPTTATSDVDGQVEYTYVAPNDVKNTRTVTVVVGYDCDSGDPRPGAPKGTKATFEIDVYDTGGGSGSGGGGGGNAAGVSSVSSTAVGTQDQGVKFTLQNDNGNEVSITDVKINDTSSKATQVSAGTKAELADNRSGDLLDAPNALEIGEKAPNYALNTTSTIPAGERTQYTLTDFEQNNGNDGSLAGESVTVTLYFSDGSAATFQFTNL